MKIEKAIEVLHDVGVAKSTTLEIMYELLENANKYANNSEAIEKLLKEKLSIEEFISVKNQFILDA
jgi:hypothetical protein